MGGSSKVGRRGEKNPRVKIGHHRVSNYKLAKYKF
jgi:hypothetical protein